MLETITTEQQLSPTNPLPQQGNGNGRTPFSQLLDQFDFPQPQRGDIIQGEILRIDEDVLYVDVGSKRDAMVPYEEVSELDETLLENLSQGDEVPIYVTHTPIGDEQLLVSLERGLQQLDWERAAAAQENDETVELEVVGYNKGGLEVKFDSIQGFVPNSHTPELRNVRNKKERQQYKAKLIGTTRPLKVIEVDSKQDRLILSETAAQHQQRQQRLQSLTLGETITGEVVHLKKFGAFVDIGDGLTGLLHISNIDWNHINHPSERLAVGEDVTVKVDGIDIERERVSLNRKELLPSPWEQFATAYKVGDLVDGRVTAVVDYGAFIQLPTGVEGLLHQSEMNIYGNGTPADVLQPGDNVLVRIVSIKPEQKRIGLSMRRVSTAEEAAWLSAAKEGSHE